ncbi:TPA: glycosyltransferase, partial [Streptococcus suis]
RKNIKKMIDFFSKKISPNEYLVVLGTGKYFDYLKDFESTQIKIIGFKKNVIDYMFASDCYVSFSQSEGFPISVIEALSCNLKLLVSDIPSHKEFFELNRDSYLGEFFNENDLPQKFCLIRKNEKISSRLIYENYLTNSIMMNAYQKLYYNLYVFGD